MEGNTPIIVVELVLVLGGALAFAWWQLRDVKRDQEKAAAERARAVAARAAQDAGEQRNDG